MPQQIDLLDAESLRACLAKIDTVNALVHAAGFMRVAPLGDLDAEAGRAMWRLHVDVAALLADALAPRLPAGGRIVLVGSRTASGAAGRSQYAATKAALIGMARSWAITYVLRDQMTILFPLVIEALGGRPVESLLPGRKEDVDRRASGLGDDPRLTAEAAPSVASAFSGLTALRATGIRQFTLSAYSFFYKIYIFNNNLFRTVFSSSRPSNHDILFNVTSLLDHALPFSSPW